MKTRDKAELGLIAAATAAMWLAAPRLPHSLAAGELVLAGAGLLLFQGLVRDLWFKFRRGQIAVAPPPAANGAGPATRRRQPIFCMCMESSIGVVGVMAGAALLLAGIRAPVQVPDLFWPGFILFTCLLGFVIKNYVFDWQTWPWRIRRVEDHSSIVFW